MRGKKLHALWIGITVLMAACIAGPVAADTVYTVSKGDTAYAIARKHHVSVQSVLKANRLTEHSILSIGRTLRIPGSESEHRRTTTAASEPANTKQPDNVKLTSKRSALRCVPWYEKASTPASNTEKEVSTTDDIIRTAIAYRGSRYRYGGTSRGGFDCSGFTRYIYAKYGVNLPHSSKSQFWHGRPVSRDELKPGDLVFFHTHSSGISHVGIYIGNDRFIHASNVRRGVTVDSLSSNYYSARYRGARRVK